MTSAGSQRADSRLRPEALPPLNPLERFGHTLSSRSVPSQVQIIARRFAISEEPRGPPPFLQPTNPVYAPVPQDRSYEAGFNKQRPRHVPIVIAPAIIDSVLKDLPPADIVPERPSQPTPRATLRLTYDFEKEETLLLSKAPPRPRHIPIVIPHFAQPPGLFPPTPPSSGNSTPRASQTAPFSWKQLLTEMSRPTTSGSRTSTLDSNASAPSPNQMYAGRFKPSSSTYLADMNSSSESSLQDQVHEDGQTHIDSAPRMSRAGETTNMASERSPPTTNGTTNLSGLVCNVHKCTGKEPHALVGATTTILGDKLYVFGGRVLSRRRPYLTSDLYELDLVRRHWTKVETTGDIPPARYFHSVCSLGDAKLICYGGMSPAPNPAHGQGQPAPSAEQPDTIVMSDIHIYDAHTRRWTHVATSNTPQGRYAHCAAVLPSSATFTSANAPLSAIHHNPPSSIPNQGSLGVALDGTGGAEMVVVGGQDSANHYIEQISVFNLRSLKWTDTTPLGRSCGAYRSVVAPLTSLPASKIGQGPDQPSDQEGGVRRSERADTESSMLIYSNYNFLDVKLELQIRTADGALVEKPMSGQSSPPGLRFPNGGVLDNHFVVSGTYLTSSKQEYALWTLDLKTLTWSRIDVGGGIFSQGSWNRGILWPRRNTFVILGNRKRSLVEDYNHRRINFSNICMVELEAFGLYDNPRQAWPTSNYPSISAPVLPPSVIMRTQSSAGRPLTSTAIDLGLMAMNMRDLADMDLISIGGERVPVNSYLLARRWGPFFVQLLRECTAASSSSFQNDASSSSDGGTLRPGHLNPQSATSRNSSITITPSITTTPSIAGSSLTANSNQSNNTLSSNRSLDPPTPNTLSPTSRPRQLYLPHTVLTIRALVHYLYTSSLPSPPHILCTPQILCSLLQLARPYRIDGLLEATVERLHQILDGRNAAALFNAAAMAAGGGRGTGLAFSKEDEQDSIDDISQTGLTITHAQGGRHRRRRSDDAIESGDETGSEVSGSEIGSSAASESENEYATQRGGRGGERRVAVGAEEIWSGGMSCVVGLQKRGLKGLMEGRRARERGQGQQPLGRGVMSPIANGAGNGIPGSGAESNTHAANGTGVGLGIA